MPRVTKEQKKESIIHFANDVIKLIKDNLNLDNEVRETKPYIECNGWYYYLGKGVVHINPEIRITRQNYRPGDTRYYKDQPKSNRIYESAWVYKEGMNRVILGKDSNGFILAKDDGFIIDGFSIQDYKIHVF